MREYSIDSIKKLFEYIGCDLSHREIPASISAVLKGYFTIENYRLIVWLRICQYLKLKHKWLYPVAYCKFARFKKKVGIDLNVSTPCGKGLSVVHGGAVYLNAERIGENCTFYQGVTLGVASKNEDKRPIIEDNVTVYTGAVIVGG